MEKLKKDLLLKKQGVINLALDGREELDSLQNIENYLEQILDEMEGIKEAIKEIEDTIERESNTEILGMLEEIKKDL